MVYYGSVVIIVITQRMILGPLTPVPDFEMVSVETIRPDNQTKDHMKTNRKEGKPK